MKNRLWLDTHWTDDLRSEMKPVFGIADRELPMPSCVVPRNLTLTQVDKLLPSLADGAVALGYGTFWVIWFKGGNALRKITDMHGGCLQRRKGKWILLGAS